MECTFTFNVGEESISFTLETENGDLVLDQDIVNALKSDKNDAEKLFNLIQDRLNGDIKPINYQKILEEKALIPNTNVQALRNLYPDIFPDDIDADVLLVNNIRVGKESIQGRCINSNGKEIFVIENTEDGHDIKKFAQYLRVKQQILNSEVKIEDEEINSILQETKHKDVKSLILDFIDNESKYINLFVNNKSCYRTLYDISKQLLNAPTMKKFGDSLTDNIYLYLYQHKVWKKSKDGKWVQNDNLYKLDASFLYNLLCVYDKSILEDNSIDTNQSEKGLTQFIDALNSSKIGETIFNKIKEKFPQFNFTFNKFENKTIFAQSVPQTVYEQYGWTYDTIKTFDIQETYRGYQIYARDDNGTKRYYVTKNYMTEKSYVSEQNSIEEAKKYIDNKINYAKIETNSNIEFHQLEGNIIQKSNLTVGSIVKVLDYTINKFSQLGKFPANEQGLLQGTFNKFKEVVNSWQINNELKEKILSKIDTPEKVMLFLYDLQDNYGSTRNVKGINQILKKFNNPKYKYYYVDEKVSNDKYRVIQTNESDINTYKKTNKNIPAVKFLKAISQGIKEKIPNINIHIETAEQLKSMVPDINTTRAFIKDGEIYLNSSLCKATDLVHEYIHLILGMLRANPQTRSNYEQLLYEIVSSNNKSVSAAKSRIAKAYPDISQMDQYEEIFADLFSRYFIDNGLNVFKSDKFKQLTETIFGQKIDNINQFYTGNIYQVFIKFNNDIASWLNNNNNISWEKSKTFRQLSNYISKQIKDGKIKESCI